MNFDNNYVTLAVSVIGFISVLLTHKYHINIHSKKLAKIEKDLNNVLTTVNQLTEVADPTVANYVNEVSTVVNQVEQTLNKSDRLG